jgi:hypothetical protein
MTAQYQLLAQITQPGGPPQPRTQPVTPARPPSVPPLPPPPTTAPTSVTPATPAPGTRPPPAPVTTQPPQTTKDFWLPSRTNQEVGICLGAVFLSILGGFLIRNVILKHMAARRVGPDAATNFGTTVWFFLCLWVVVGVFGFLYRWEYVLNFQIGAAVALVIGFIAILITWRATVRSREAYRS